MKEIDFSELPIGTKVWSIANDWGKIIDTYNVNPHYEVKVKFLNCVETYTKCGRENIDDLHTSLFLNSFEIPESAYDQSKMEKETVKEDVMIDLTKPQIFSTPVKCWVNNDNKNWIDRWLVAIDENGSFLVFNLLSHSKEVKLSHLWNIGSWKYCTLEDPNKPKMRYMTHEEQAAWIVTVGSNGHLMREKKTEKWSKPWSTEYVKDCEYCTADWNNGKPIFGEQQDFLIEEK